jgi:hypothetical protein
MLKLNHVMWFNQLLRLLYILVMFAAESSPVHRVPKGLEKNGWIKYII